MKLLTRQKADCSIATSLENASNLKEIHFISQPTLMVFAKVAYAELDNALLCNKFMIHFLTQRYYFLVLE